MYTKSVTAYNPKFSNDLIEIIKNEVTPIKKSFKTRIETIDYSFWDLKYLLTENSQAYLSLTAQDEEIINQMEIDKVSNFTFIVVK